MKLILLTPGATAAKWLAEGIDAYAERLRHYIDFQLLTVANARRGDEMARRAAECGALLAATRPDDAVVLLDERGAQPTSVQLAQMMQTRMNSGVKRLVMVIGGPYGFTKELYGRADAQLALSRLTMTHEMARLVLVEQLYRAMTILRGEKYHHQ